MSQHFRLWKSWLFLTKAQNRYNLHPDKWHTGEDTHLLHRATRHYPRTVLMDCAWKRILLQFPGLPALLEKLGSPESSQHMPDLLLLNSPTVNKRLEHTPDVLSGKPELIASPHLIQLVSPKAHSNSALGWQQITNSTSTLSATWSDITTAHMSTFTYLGGDAGGV